MVSYVQAPKTRKQVADLDTGPAAQSSVQAQLASFNPGNIQPDLGPSKQLQDLSTSLSTVNKNLVSYASDYAQDESAKQEEAFKAAFAGMTPEETRKYYDEQMPQYTGLFSAALDRAYGSSVAHQRRVEYKKRAAEDPNFLINEDPMALLNQARTDDLGAAPSSHIMSGYDATMGAFNRELEFDIVEAKGAEKLRKRDETFVSTIISMAEGDENPATFIDNFRRTKGSFNETQPLQVSNREFNALTMNTAQRLAQIPGMEAHVEALLGPDNEGRSLLSTKEYGSKAGVILANAKSISAKARSEAVEPLFVNAMAMADNNQLPSSWGNERHVPQLLADGWTPSQITRVKFTAKSSGELNQWQANDALKATWDDQALNGRLPYDSTESFFAANPSLAGTKYWTADRVKGLISNNRINIKRLDREFEEEQTEAFQPTIAALEEDVNSGIAFEGYNNSEEFMNDPENAELIKYGKLTGKSVEALFEKNSTERAKNLRDEQDVFIAADLDLAAEGKFVATYGDNAEQIFKDRETYWRDAGKTPEYIRGLIDKDAAAIEKKQRAADKAQKATNKTLAEKTVLERGVEMVKNDPAALVGKQSHSLGEGDTFAEYSIGENELRQKALGIALDELVDPEDLQGTFVKQAMFQGERGMLSDKWKSRINHGVTGFSSVDAMNLQDGELPKSFATGLALYKTMKAANVNLVQKELGKASTFYENYEASLEANEGDVDAAMRHMTYVAQNPEKYELASKATLRQVGTAVDSMDSDIRNASNRTAIQPVLMAYAQAFMQNGTEDIDTAFKQAEKRFTENFGLVGDSWVKTYDLPMVNDQATGRRQANTGDLERIQGAITENMDGDYQLVRAGKAFFITTKGGALMTEDVNIEGIDIRDGVFSLDSIGPILGAFRDKSIRLAAEAAAPKTEADRMPQPGQVVKAVTPSNPNVRPPQNNIDTEATIDANLPDAPVSNVLDRVQEYNKDKEKKRKFEEKMNPNK